MRADTYVRRYVYALICVCNVYVLIRDLNVCADTAIAIQVWAHTCVRQLRQGSIVYMPVCVPILHGEIFFWLGPSVKFQVRLGPLRQIMAGSWTRQILRATRAPTAYYPPLRGRRNFFNLLCNMNVHKAV